MGWWVGVFILTAHLKERQISRPSMISCVCECVCMRVCACVHVCIAAEVVVLIEGQLSARANCTNSRK